MKNVGFIPMNCLEGTNQHDHKHRVWYKHWTNYHTGFGGEKEDTHWHWVPTLRFSWISEVAIFFSLLCFIVMASMRSHSLDSFTFFVGNIEHLQLLWGQQAFM